MLNLFKKNYEDINEATVQTMMKEKDTMIVDVRESYEYTAGHIVGAKHIPLGSLPNRLTELDQNKTIILVCASGARSGRAASFLSKKGYKVMNLIGGMMRWSGKVK